MAAVTAYSRATASLHWASAATLMGAIGTVLVAQNEKDKPTKAQLMFAHKSLGLLTGGLLLPRVAAAVLTKRPGALPGSSKVEHLAGVAGHWALYGFSFVMAGSGIAMGCVCGGVCGRPLYVTPLHPFDLLPASQLLRWTRPAILLYDAAGSRAGKQGSR
jgi:cytochrome b561